MNKLINPSRINTIIRRSISRMSSSSQSSSACNQSSDKNQFVDKNALRKRLTPIQYHVTQEKGTERPFSGEYLKLKDNGIYSCVVCGNELFGSDSKFDSGCGWPAFSRVVTSNNVHLTPDLSHDLVRTEVSCKRCNSHLGHVFNDGPKPEGMRYCINSASLNFKKSNGIASKRLAKDSVDQIDSNNNDITK